MKKRTTFGFVVLLVLAPVAWGADHSARTIPSRVGVIITDTRATFSPRRIAAGTVVFRVANGGKRRHRLEIAGKTTRMLAPGDSTVLRVSFAHTGRVKYVVPGLPVGWLQVTAIASGSNPSPTSTTPTGTTPSQLCKNPAPNTVGVTMTDTSGPTGYTFSPTTPRCGTVTFVLTNTGKSGHGLDLRDPLGEILPPSPRVAPGSAITITIDLRYSGTYDWADISAGFDAEFAETSNGSLVVQ
jgi:hypothetical protein